MRLNLRKIMHVPGASESFEFQMDLSDLDFYGARPIAHPVTVKGLVRNNAGALTLEGTAGSLLELTCDRCGKSFSREKTVRMDTLLAQKLENEDNDDIVLLEGDELDLEDLATTAFVLEMDSKNLCAEDCKGLCPGCGADLNEEPCRCAKETDPRLAALAQLLDK
ncbi:hypothetical protein SDC9_103904 [bioreactor metagenome]|uniref:Large ribosomal RNA subunit accumulation protein YceD n=1 Tax=bioreactor metagenome TaxID=1076179 RepID=A0A645AWA8_9ZZZZ